MGKLAAGTLDRRVHFERLTPDGQTSSGMPREEWRPLGAAVWAGKRRGRGAEVTAPPGRHASETAEWVIRWQPALADLNPKDRMIHANQIYDILAVQDPDRRESLVVTTIRHAD